MLPLLVNLHGKAMPCATTGDSDPQQTQNVHSYVHVRASGELLVDVGLPTGKAKALADRAGTGQRGQQVAHAVVIRQMQTGDECDPEAGDSPPAVSWSFSVNQRVQRAALPFRGRASPSSPGSSLVGKRMWRISTLVQSTPRRSYGKQKTLGYHPM